jgi:putative ATP-binding cassette transporter
MKRKPIHQFIAKPAALAFGFGMVLSFLVFPLTGEVNKQVSHFTEIRGKVEELMKDGKSPGLALVMIKGDELFIEGFGYADQGKKIPVTEDTLFEIGSCSKSFTALAVLQLAQKGLIRLTDPVSQYFPWFYAVYKKQEYQITIRQLLHQASGISWGSIDRIPSGNSSDALEQTVKQLVGIELKSIPGKQFEHTSVNYDILGAVIEKVSGQSFEDYMRNHIFVPLGLLNTTVGIPMDKNLMATGYKIGFLSPRPYIPPVYRGNYPAGYVVTNARDMARWLKIQLNLVKTPLDPLIAETHLWDRTIPPDKAALSFYALGWYVSLKGDCKIENSGKNPNFVCHMGFHPESRTAAAVLCNSDSSYVEYIYKYVMAWVAGETPPIVLPSQNKLDIACTIITLAMGAYILAMIVLIVLKIIGIFRGKSRFEPMTLKKSGKIVGLLLLFLPYLLGVFLLPKAVLGVSWKTLIVWTPVSVYVVLLFLLASFAVGFVKYIITQLFPNRNRYLNEIPLIVLLGILTGFANTGILFIITTAFYSSVSMGYLLFYFIIIYGIYAFGAKTVSSKMIKITNNITLDMRTDLITKVISARYQRFETLDDGQILATLNNDTAALAGSANFLVGAITSIITVLSGFVYMMNISFIATLVVLALLGLMIFYYYFISAKYRKYLEEARDTQNVYLGLLNGLIDGFKELSLHFEKKKEYREDLFDSCRRFCSKSITAGLKFLNARIISGSFMMIIVGTVSIVIPRMLTDVKTVILVSFVMILLYLLGPITAILSIIPTLLQIKVSWDRIKDFIGLLDLKIGEESAQQLIKRLNAAESSENSLALLVNNPTKPRVVESIQVENAVFEYDAKNEKEKFSLGPVNLEIKKGEACFIIGGNGSGKTTLGKLITGLYIPKQGTVKINGEEIKDIALGEYYSTVFSDYHLFRKIYEVDIEKQRNQVDKYLKLFELEKKVQLKGNHYSTIDLSGGQRKRLALMQCFLEDSPIYLFDEFAANQEPGFRKFFYRELLLDLKKQGKIVIAVTHDDHYFDVADKIIKLDVGNVDLITTGNNFRTNEEVA